MKYHMEKVDSQTPPVLFGIQRGTYLLFWWILFKLYGGISWWLFSCTQEYKMGRRKKHKHQSQWIEQLIFGNGYDHNHYNLFPLQVQEWIYLAVMLTHPSTQLLFSFLLKTSLWCFLISCNMSFYITLVTLCLILYLSDYT